MKSIISRKKLRKKGSITDISFILIGIFSVALVALLVTYVVNSLNDEVQVNDIFPDNAKDASTKMNDDFPNVMDSGIIFIFFGMCIISLILASLVPIHPMFLAFYFIEYLLLIYVSGTIANAYKKVIEVGILSDAVSKYELTIFMFQYMPFIIGIFGIVLAIVMYKIKQGITQ